jgi:hypothetical protein
MMPSVVMDDDRCGAALVVVMDDDRCGAALVAVMDDDRCGAALVVVAQGFSPANIAGLKAMRRMVKACAI